MCAPDAAKSADEQWQQVTECAGREIKGAATQLNVAGYPIGWKRGGQPGQSLLSAILGFLLTGLAVSLGSSFWFDLLGKFMNVRMTGKRENSTTAAARARQRRRHVVDLESPGSPPGRRRQPQPALVACQASRIWRARLVAGSIAWSWLSRFAVSSIT